MTDYDSFSAFYDRFTEDVDYEANADRLLRLFEKYDRKPTLLLDLACGTGGFTFPLAKRGIEVVGVDRSAGMLSKATEKLAPGETNPVFLNQSAENLELYGTVDGAVCMLDSLNHITNYDIFCQAIARVALFLEKDRLFIFDLNTEYKHSFVLGDNAFVREDDKAFCVWQNDYRGEGLVDIYLDFFVGDGENYKRFTEEFSEKAYTKAEILNALQISSLELVAELDGFSENSPSDTSERITYIVRKK